MGFFSGAAARVRNLLRWDKSQIQITLAKGATGSTMPVTGFDLMQSYGHDALQDYLRIENDMMSKFVDIENMDEDAEPSSALDIFADDCCITGDTVIPMLDGSQKTVKELFDNNVSNAWVYGFDIDKKEVVPCQFEKVIVINESLPVYKVNFVDKFGQTGSIKATAGHKWLMLNNKYVPTEELKVGDRLNALFKFNFHSKGRKQDYENVWVSYSKRWRSTHRMVLGGLGKNPPPGHVVHHLNHIGTDNRPDNLQIMTKEEHLNEHQKFTGKNNPKYRYQFCIDDFLYILENEGYLSKREMQTRLGCSYRIVERLSREAGYQSYKDLKFKMFGKKKNAQCHNNQTNITKRDLENFKAICSLIINNNDLTGTAVAENLELNYKLFHIMIKRTGFGWPELKNKIINNEWRPEMYLRERELAHNFHKINDFEPNDIITSIELVGNETVYDLINSMPTHNFAAGSKDRWVFIKNSQVDSLTNKALWVDSSDRTIKEVLTDLFDVRLRIEEELWSDARILCKYGNKYDELLVTDEGLVGTNALNAPTMRRIEGRRGELYGFIQDTKGRFGYSSLEFRELLAQRSSAQNTFDQDRNNVIALEDWEVVHTRLRSKNKRSLYGGSVIESGRWIWKRLKLLEDAAMIYELERSPQRYAFYVDTGDMPPKEAYAYVQKVRQQYKKVKFYNPNTNQLDFRYNPLCVTKDTKVPLLDGRHLTVGELVNEFNDGKENWCYSIDLEDKNRLVPGKIEWAGPTRKDAELVEVELDNNKTIRCTPDHKFLTRKGCYIEAQHLKPGDSLMPWRTFVSSKKRGDSMEGYEIIYDPIDEDIDHHKRYKYTHRVVRDHPNIRAEVIHHKDFNKRNNRPDNLQPMTRNDHMRLHEDSGHKLAEWYKNKLKSDPVFAKMNSDQARINIYKYLGSVKHSADTTRNNKIRNTKKYLLAYNKTPKHTEDNKIRSAVKAQNHKVKSVKMLNYKEDTYCITVGEYHNFATSAGVFIKNSVSDDFFLSVRKGESSSKIDVLNSPKWNSTDLINYFRLKMFASIKVPMAYVGSDSPISKGTLSQQDVRFCRTVLRIQRELRNGYGQMARTHLAALNIDPRAVDFQLYMTVPGAIFEVAQLEARNAKADFAGRMSQFVSLHWILSKVFGLSETEVEYIIKQKHEEQLDDAEIMAKAAGLNVQAQGVAQQQVASQQSGGAPGQPGANSPPGGQQAEDVRALLRSMSGMSRTWSQKRQMYGHKPITEKELFEGNRDHEKKLEDNFEKLMKNDLMMNNRLLELRELIEEIKHGRNF